ncbi:hypothetical protein JCM9140_3334 [Halalkalibacter wakoensis JCM 9140]|uniref:NERD domain-containing protein n=1 Tax=Halalkalibacter wakoensis JCM 9140 TaxID=1236970 RepID=W4Q5D0_9BACI|nr:hypothetical protein JCM9140_3334 [Halalkalibacter wakoensis JCM 9140]
MLRRLPNDDPLREKLEAELSKGKAGYRGEQAIDYHLERLSDVEGYILHDLRLELSNNHFFQIDTFLATQQFFHIIEIKNLAGTLYFDHDFKQLIRSLKGEEEKFLNPITQVSWQKKNLQTWLESNKLQKPPILSQVAITHSQAIIKTTPMYKEVYEKVLHAEHLVEKVHHYLRTYPNEAISLKQLNQITRLLIKKNTPYHPDLLAQYGIKPSRLLTGVHCPTCKQLPMRRKNGMWICDFCQAKSGKAHLHTLNDYFLLVDRTITNQQVRHFLKIPSISIASKMLTSLQLPQTGMKKNRRYQLQLLEVE